jgi:hypothetical protein
VNAIIAEDTTLRERSLTPRTTIRCHRREGTPGLIELSMLYLVILVLIWPANRARWPDER